MDWVGFLQVGQSIVTVLMIMNFGKLGNLCLDGTAVVAHPVCRAIVGVCERSLIVGGRTVAFNMVIIIVVVVWEAFQ